MAENTQLVYSSGFIYAYSNPDVGVEAARRTKLVEFDLMQNFPNPFNPTTTFSFCLVKSGSVRLTLHNLQGQQVAVILDEVKPAGPHQQVWRADHLASGIYFYHLQTGGFGQIKKCMILK